MNRSDYFIIILCCLSIFILQGLSQENKESNLSTIRIGCYTKVTKDSLVDNDTLQALPFYLDFSTNEIRYISGVDRTLTIRWIGSIFVADTNSIEVEIVEIGLRNDGVVVWRHK